MKINKLVQWSVLCVSMALAFTATAGEQVPFKGRHSGQITSTGFSFPYASSTAVGEGYATEAGHFTLEGEVVVDVITGVGNGMWTLTAANGDRLFMVHVGETLDPYHAVGHFTIVGGTGRFEGATGSYTDHITFGVALGTAPEMTYTDLFSGTISTVGSEH